MNKKIKFLILGVILLIITLFIVISVNKNELILRQLSYDILIQQHHDPTYDPDLGLSLPGGVATHYYYTAVNSIKKEKYTIKYSNLYNNGSFNRLDPINITIELLDDNELQDIMNKYTKTSKLNKLKKLLDTRITEDYKVTSITTYKHGNLISK